MLWFRFYSEVLNDPKIQKLPLEAFKIWVNLLCYAAMTDNTDGFLGPLENVAYALRVTVRDAFGDGSVTIGDENVTVAPLVRDGLITVTCDGIKIKQWNKRQYKSDTSAERTRRWRERHKNVTVTAPDQTRTEPDTEQTRDSISLVERAMVNNGHAGHNHNGSGNGLENGFDGFRSVGFEISMETAEWLLGNAPGWSQHFLQQKYAGWLSGKDKPRNPQAAFKGWVKNFTKGQRPS